MWGVEFTKVTGSGSFDEKLQLLLECLTGTKPKGFPDGIQSLNGQIRFSQMAKLRQLVPGFDARVSKSSIPG